MGGTSPDYSDWRQLASIKVWEIAALMHGFDPRAGADVADRDPDDPTSPYGVSPDLSWEKRMLISSVEAGELITAPAGIMVPDSDTGILKTSLVHWLRSRGNEALAYLADELATSAATIDSNPTPIGCSAVPDPQRRLDALRALKGDAKWIKMKWRFTKIKELVVQEKRAKKPRSDEKTIRKDLIHAADAERMAKRSGATP